MGQSGLTAIAFAPFAFTLVGCALSTESEQVDQADEALGIDTTAEKADVVRINTRRKNEGKHALFRSLCLTEDARAWAKHLGQLAHFPTTDAGAHYHFAKRVTSACGSNWTSVGENAAYDSEGEPAAYVDLIHSPEHRANIDGAFNFVGVGVYDHPDGTAYVVQVFARCVNPTTHLRCGGKWDDPVP